MFGGASVRFLPTQATVSLELSQLHNLGHFTASTEKFTAKITNKLAAAAKKHIYEVREGLETLLLHEKRR